MKKLLLFLCFAVSLAKAQDTVTIVHQRYTTTFDKTLHYPVLVHWVLYASDLCTKTDSNYCKRTDDFKPDPELSDVTNLKADYHLGSDRYDRGHNMDAADNSCNIDQMHECFYFSNMTPQTKHLNEITWERLEAQTRKLAKQYGTVEVWCGSYGSVEKIGQVTVPAFCWKVIKYNNTEVAYIFPNTADVNLNPYTAYKSTVSSVRLASHLLLPDL